MRVFLNTYANSHLYKVSFDGHQQIRIELNDLELFREKTNGICGFLDNR